MRRTPGDSVSRGSSHRSFRFLIPDSRFPIPEVGSVVERVLEWRRDAALVTAPAALRDGERVDARANDLGIAEAVLRVRAAHASVVTQQAAAKRPMHVGGIRRRVVVVAVVQQMTENEDAVAEVRLVVAQVRAEALAE